MNETLIFLGAGASNPFGMPTMKDLVSLFESDLKKNGNPHEVDLYERIKKILKEKYDGPDLEAVFGVIDRISQNIRINNWDDGTYFYYRAYLEKYGKVNLPPDKYRKIKTNDIETAKTLKKKFETFIKNNCLIKDNNFEKIDKVYSEFFSYFAREGQKAKIKGKNVNVGMGAIQGGDHHYRRWPFFTTNYDMCLESYWEGKNVTLNMGFRPDPGRRRTIMDAQIFNNEHDLKLFKLHGSINWFREEDGKIVEYPHRPTSTSFRRGQAQGEVMIYPISEKYMYTNPFLDMFYHFRNELVKSPCWLIMGYSLRDEAIKNLLLENANEDKMMIVVHPRAKMIIEKELKDIQIGELIPIELRFGDEGLAHEIVGLMRNP